MEVTRAGLMVPKTASKSSNKDLIAKLKRELTVCPASTVQQFPKRFKVYAETPTHYVVPRFWTCDGIRDARDARAPGQSVSMNFAGVLRPELSQPQAADAVLKSLRDAGGAVMCLPTGYGKTCTALYIASKVGRKTLILTHKAFLKDQWIDRIRKFLPGTTVTEIQGGVCDTSGDVVVAMIQTLISRKFPPSFFETFGFLCVDECHHIAAEVFSRAMHGLAFPKVLGLSATPTRRDGLTRVLHWHLGPLAYEIKRTNQSDVVVRTLRYTCPRFREPPPMNKRGDICHTSIVSELAANSDRTDRIVDVVREYAHRDVLVLSHRREHCKTIAERCVAHGIDAAAYLGGQKDVPQTRVIVATYALTSEGFDCPRLNTLVLATPASDVNQSCGRILRGNDTSTKPVIVDVVDEWGVCFAQHAKRRRYYREAGFTVVPYNAGMPHHPGPGFAPVTLDAGIQNDPKSIKFLFID